MFLVAAVMLVCDNFTLAIPSLESQWVGQAEVQHERLDCMERMVAKYFTPFVVGGLVVLPLGLCKQAKRALWLTCRGQVSVAAAGSVPGHQRNLHYLGDHRL